MALIPVVGCLGCGLSLVLYHMYLFCGTGKRSSSYPGHAFLMENHQNTNLKPNHTNMLMTSAFIIAMKIPLAKLNHMAKSKVTGEM